MLWVRPHLDKTLNFSQNKENSTEAPTKYERPKMKRYARRKCSLLKKKTASLLIFGHLYFIWALLL